MLEKEIAIFIPCYNAARTLSDTLTSVEKAIAHFGTPVPVYIYDDGSKDDSLKIARETWKDTGELIIRNNPANLGERMTTNQAFGDLFDSYDWVFIIHSDDIVKPEWLTEM